MRKTHIIEVEQEINVPIGKVWEAFTNPTMTKQFFFGSDLTTSWEVGTSLFFRGEWEGTKYEDKGIVISFETEKSLAYSYLSSWSNLPDLPENYLWIQYEVSPTASGTKVKISQSNYDQERAQHSTQLWEGVIEAMEKALS